MLFRLAAFVIAVVLFGLEAGAILYLRDMLSNGFAPAIQRSDPPKEITGLSDRGWTDFDATEIEKIRSEVEKDLGDLSGSSPDRTALMLRDWTRKQAEGKGTYCDTKDPVETLEALRTRETGWCYPLAIVYSAALSAYGITSRRIGLFSEPGSFDYSHTTVEAWIGSKWILEDPTFDAVAVGPDNQKLSAAEIQDYYARGIGVSWDQDAGENDPKMEGYEVSPDKLYKIIVYDWPTSPPGSSAWESRIDRFRDRLIGRIDTVIVSKGRFPAPEWLTSGLFDRLALPPALVLLLMSAFPYRNHRATPPVSGA
jgi:hypothetical protein